MDGNSPRLPIQAHKNIVNSISFSPDGKKLVSSGKDRRFLIWDLSSGEKLLDRYFPYGSGSGFQRIVVSPDGKILGLNIGDRIRLLSSIDGKELRAFNGYNFSFSPDSKMLALISPEDNIQLWSINGELLATIKGNTSKNTGLSFNPNGKMLASASEDGTIILWNLDLNLLLSEACDWVHDYLNNPNVSESDKHLCDDSNQFSAQPSENSTGETTSVPTPTTPDKQAEVKLIDPKAAKEISELKGHQGSVLSVAFSPDGQTLATTGADGTIRLWNAQGEPLSQFKGHQNAIRSINFSSDGQQLVSDAGNKIRLWNLQGKLLRQDLRNCHKQWRSVAAPRTK